MCIVAVKAHKCRNRDKNNKIGTTALFLSSFRQYKVIVYFPLSIQRLRSSKMHKMCQNVIQKMQVTIYGKIDVGAAELVGLRRKVGD